MEIDFWLGNKLSTLPHHYYETQQFHSLIDKSKHWKARGIERQPSNTSSSINYWLSLLLQKAYTQKYSERYLILVTNLLFHIITVYIYLKWTQIHIINFVYIAQNSKESIFLHSKETNKLRNIQTHETKVSGGGP